ncbi:MAG: hypothetical protein DMG03_18460 [Acidobacteria bacterium]|nr:MAG: hypothetical protein DMG03_18460 [Acidobacteriota bacterium]
MVLPGMANAPTRSMNVRPAGVWAKVASIATTLGRYALMLSIADARLAEAKVITRPGSDVPSRIAATLLASATMIETSGGMLASRAIATGVPVLAGSISFVDPGSAVAGTSATQC